MAIQKRFIHFKKFSDFNSKKLSANEANTQYTVGVSGAIQNGEPDVLYSSYCWIKDTQQQWTHGQLYDGSVVDLSLYLTADEIEELYTTHEDLNNKQDTLVSGTNIKTINGESILGEGDLTVEGGGGFFLPLSLFEETPTISQEDYDNLVNTINNGGVIKVPFEVTTNSVGGVDTVSYSISPAGILLCVSLDTMMETFQIIYIITNDLTIVTNEVSWIKASKLSQLENDSNFVSSDGLKTINGESIVGSGNLEIGGNSDANVQAVDTGDAIDEVTVNYATKAYVDGLVGDINSVLESIING